MLLNIEVKTIYETFAFTYNTDLAQTLIRLFFIPHYFTLQNFNCGLFILKFSIKLKKFYQLPQHFIYIERGKETETNRQKEGESEVLISEIKVMRCLK